MDIVTYAKLKKGKADLVNGKVPSAQLPSYVSEVIEVATKSDLPTTGEASKIYVTLDTKQSYRWSGSTYIPTGNIDIPLTTTADQVLISTNTSGQTAWSALSNKQDTLVSGTNIKTVNGQSILGSGDLPAGLVDDVKVDGQSVITNKIANIDLSGKQDVITDLETIRAGAALGATAIQTHQDISGKADKTEVTEKVNQEATARTSADEALQANINQKQDTISDLASIRSGASAGATAVQPSAISDMATKTWVGDQGYLTEHQSLDAYETTAAVTIKLATKQDKLSAGNNITIQNNTISALDAQIGRTFTTNTAVGNIAAGTEISSEQTLKELIYNMLYKQPTTSLYSQYKESSEAEGIPTTIDSTWTQSEISADVKTNGLTFTVTTSAPSTGYLSFAFNKSLGQLKYIYQNNLPFDIKDNWVAQEITYNNVVYYMYVSKGTEYLAQLVSGDTFTLLWQ